MFDWKKEFELGIDSIDTQHQKLLEIGNRISALLVQHEDGDDNYDDIMEVLDELTNYTIYHFKVEEDYFLKYNYPDYEKHKAEHDAFIDYLHSIDLKTVEEEQKAFLKELLKKIVNWVFNHIITTDFLYKDFMISQGMK